ncbi:MAG: Uma2 family endonuclease [Acidobacteria bacterium]|nr:Uma2 family endonuclease [Acidobacteriota bacterium]
MAEATAGTYRWSREAYDRAVDAGVFGPDDRIELIDGEIVGMTPQGSRHAAAVIMVAKVVERAFGAGCHVRPRTPLAIGPDSEPEPDIAVVEGAPGDYLDAHPTTALLAVEVSDDSLRRDRTVKQRLYARHGLPEYWIVALPDARLEVHREPAADGYRSVRIYRRGDRVAPLARPGTEIAVDDLLP